MLPIEEKDTEKERESKRERDRERERTSHESITRGSKLESKA